MKQTFDMSDLSLLCVEVHQDAAGITLLQTHYAKRILELGGMDGCNPTHTPMEERLRLSRHSTTTKVNPTHYRRLIESLHYLVHMRPDLAFAVGYVNRFIEGPTVEHQGAVKRIRHQLCQPIHGGAHGGTSRCCQAYLALHRRRAPLRPTLHQGS